jgi:hypothetical protein
MLLNIAALSLCVNAAAFDRASIGVIFDWLSGSWTTAADAPDMRRVTFLPLGDFIRIQMHVANPVGAPDRVEEIASGVGGAMFLRTDLARDRRGGLRLIRIDRGERRSALFERQSGIFPERVEYAVERGVLTRTASMLDGSRLQVETYTLQEVQPAR